MLDQIEALTALHEEGTMSRAAVRLRVTQSAVSKRIAALEARVGAPLVEPSGRRVALTPAALRLLAGAAPLLAELRQLLSGEVVEAGGEIVMGVSESILASWGAAALARAAEACPGLRLRLHAHRSPVAIERVRAGEYLLALVAGECEDAPDLAVRPLLEEEMVVVPSGLRPITPGARLPVLAIEPASATWASTAPRIARLGKSLRLEVIQTVESFAALVQMARAGLGHGLAPLGVARALGVPDDVLLRPGLTRPVSLVGRRAAFARPRVAAFAAALSSAVSEVG